MGVISFMQSLSLERELLIQSPSVSVLLESLSCACTPTRKGFWDTIGIFRKLKVACDLDTV